MNARPETSISPSTAQIQERIDSERNRLLIEQNLEANLDGQRIAPLEAGDDEALDRIEAQHAQCLERQVRIQERLELLQKRLIQAKDVERVSHLDAIEARATALREDSMKQIRDVYPKQAKALAITLRRLALNEAAQEHCNRELTLGGRPAVETANAVRCRPTQRVKWKKAMRVGYTQPEHPAFGRVCGRSADGQTVYLEQGGQCPAFQDVQVETEDLVVGSNPQPLYAVIELPTAEAEPLAHASLPKAPTPAPIFDPNAPITDAEVLALLAGQRDPEGRK